MASRLVWVGVVLGLVLLLFVLASIFSPAAIAPSASNSSFFTLADARLLDWGGRPAVYARLEGNASVPGAPLQVQSDVLDAPPPRRVILLTGPWSAATRLSALQSALSASLRPAGWTVEARNLSSLGREREARFIILPSGAWPSDLLANWNSTLGPDDTLVYLGVSDNLALDEAGGVHPAPLPPELLAAGPALDERLPDSAVLSGPSGVRVWRVPHTLDEFADPASLSAILSSRMLEPYADHLLSRSASAYGGSQWSSVQWITPPGPQTGNDGLPPSGAWSPAGSSGALSSPSNAWLRLRLYDSTGRLLRLWDAPLSAPEGHLDAPTQALSGQNISLQIRLRPALPQAEQAAYELNIRSPDGRLWKTVPLGGALIGPSGSGAAPAPAPNASAGAGLPIVPASPPASAWVGSLVLRDWPGPGLLRLDVDDQYGRSFAQAVIDAPDLRATALDGGGFTRRFLLTRDGQPLNISSVSVRRDNSSSSLVLPTGDGVVSVSADWPAGAHALHFFAAGAQMDYAWTEAPGGAWAPVWQIGAPGLALAALLYLLLRPRARPVYKLAVPQWPAGSPQRLELTASQMEPLVSQAASRVQAQAFGKNKSAPASRRADAAICASDIVSLLAHPADSSKPMLVSPESAENALQALARAGRLAHWRGYYSLFARHPGQVRVLALSRLLRDRLLQEGVALSLRPSAHGVWTDAHKRRYAIWDRQRISDLARERPTHLVFADEHERKEFGRLLASDGTPPASRLKLSRQLGRLRLSLIDHPLEG